MSEVDPSMTDDDIDETIVERLIGLTEMFPESFREFSCNMFNRSLQLTKATYNFTRKCGWILYSSGIILIAPVLIESERITLDRQLQRQMLLGPNRGL